MKMTSRLTPNLNGMSAKSLMEERERIMAALDELDNAMSAAWPHGRDYQLAEDPAASLRDDVETWTDVARSVEHLRNRLTADMVKLNDHIMLKMNDRL